MRWLFLYAHISVLYIVFSIYPLWNPYLVHLKKEREMHYMDNKIISLFSGCGGMDLGFERVGFEIPVANEFDATIWETYKRNHKHTHLIEGDIRNVTKSDLEPYLKLQPGEQLAGIIGGPPCQSWSVAGAGKGIEDKRGQLFFEYIRVLREFRPQFFVAENVPGMIAKKHADAVDRILSLFAESGYNVSVYKTNACNYGLAQTRERIFYIGIRTDLDISFVFPGGDPEHIVTLKDAIWDLRDNAVPTLARNKRNPVAVNNHEYYVDSYSPVFMSRNRVRSWDESGFTVQASGRQCQIHPNAPKMQQISKDSYCFVPGAKDRYRRMSVREVARLQGFPDDFEFMYENANNGYKMIGNAVPVNMAEAIARNLMDALKASFDISNSIRED